MKGQRIISFCTAMGMMLSAAPAHGIANAVSPNADILINEVCTQNKACLTDNYGETSDWIELYNPTDKTVSLAGYTISKDPQKPKAWTFPEGAVIGAGEYLVVIASKNVSMEGEYHTGFNLDKNGEVLTLKAPDGSVVQELNVPTLGEDMTYGITYTGAYEIMKATPGKANKITVSAPEFSKPSGFYSKEFQLSLSAYEGDTIYYTTDGSDPLTSKTAQVYSGSITVKDRSDEENIYRAYGGKDGDPLAICVGMNYDPPPVPVDKAAVVRAAAKNADGVYSDVVQQIYFVTDGELADYSDMTVVSLVTDPDNLFDPDKGIYVVGNKWDGSTDPWGVDEGSNIRNFHGRGKEWEREANITVFDSGENIIEQNIGIRIKGSSTRNSVLKNFNLYARSEYGASKISYPLFPDNTDTNGDLITEYDSVSLQSYSINDAVCHKLMENRKNISTAARRPCVVFINGEYWGLYELAEKLSDDFINQHYNVKKSNVLITKNWKSEAGTDEENDEFYHLAYKYAAADLSKDAKYQEVCRYFDVDSIIEHYAAGIYFGTWDWPDYNYAAWKDKGADSDGKWHFMSFDFDYTLGSSYEEIDTKLYKYNFFEKVEKNKSCAPTGLFLSLLKNNEFRLKFAKVFKEYADRDSLSIGEEIGESNFYEMSKTHFFRWASTILGSSKNVAIGKQYAEKEVRSKMLDPMYEFLEKRPNYAMSQMYKYLNMGEIDLIETEDPTTTTTAVTTKTATTTTTTAKATTKSPTTTKAPTTTTAPVTTDPTDPETYAVADLVKLSKYLLGNGAIDDLKKYDLNGDGAVDAVDICLLRKRLIEDKCEKLPNMLSNLSWSYYVDSGDGADASFKNASGGGFTANIAKTGTEEWSIQLKYGGLTIEKGAVYQASFDYTATQAVRIKANVMETSGNYTNYACFKADADSTVRHFTGIFVMGKPTDKNARLSFDLGGKGNAPYSVTISNVRLVKIQ